MDTKPVLFFDSGIGGIPYCMDFRRKNPREPVCYLADKKNFPYGPRSSEELTGILVNLTEKTIKKITPKIIVLACNTATIVALTALRREFPQMPFVGTVPAVKPAAQAASLRTAGKTGKVGVLGTQRTIEEVRRLNLTDEKCEIIGVAAPELVDFIELNVDNCGEKEKKEIVLKYIEIFRAAGVDTLVLGCTHFLFLLEEFRREAAGFFEVFDSLDGITKRVEYLLDEKDCELRAKNDSKPADTLLLTGTQTADPFWEQRSQGFGFNLVLFNES